MTMEHTTVKRILIEFMEWQMEKKPLIANFTHNAVANNFLEQCNISEKNICCGHEKFTRNICDGCGLTQIQIKEGFVNWINKAIG